MMQVKVVNVKGDTSHPDVGITGSAVETFGEKNKEYWVWVQSKDGLRLFLNTELEVLNPVAL